MASAPVRKPIRQRHKEDTKTYRVWCRHDGEPEIHEMLSHHHQHQSYSYEELLTLSQTHSITHMSIERGVPTKLDEMVPGVKELSLKDVSKISQLEGICKLTAINLLDLSHNSSLNTLPPGIGDINTLEKLYVNSCNLTSLPESIGELQALELLNISSNHRLNALPACIGDLKSLKKLFLSSCNLSSLPQSITLLNDLEVLDISGNKLQTAIDWLGELKSLKELRLMNCTLTSIPESIDALTYLEVLDMSYNMNIQTLPDNIGKLMSLEKLNASYCNLTRLPESMRGLIGLKWLDLTGNVNLCELVEWIDNIQNLRDLRVNGCNLRSLPDSVGKLAKLEVLCVSQNKKLGTLPGSIGDINSLKILDASDCDISQLPDSFEGLDNLEALYLQDNPMNPSPERFANLSRLWRLDMRHNQNPRPFTGRQRTAEVRVSTVSSAQPKEGYDDQSNEGEEERGDRSSLYYDLQKRIEEFKSLNVESGQCSATEDHAFGKFTPKYGGILKLEDRDDIRLYIPPGALEKTEYMSMQLLNEHATTNSISFSPRVECGPNGLKFNAPVELTLPHSAAVLGDFASSNLGVISRRTYDDDWTFDEDVKVLYFGDDTITLAIRHFTGYGLSATTVPRNGLGWTADKNIEVTVFIRAKEFKVMVVAKNSASQRLISSREEKSGYISTQWQSLVFSPEQGNLLIERKPFQDDSEPTKFLTLVNKAVMALGQRYHIERRKGDQETEILFYMGSIDDDTEKLQIVAVYPDEQHQDTQSVDAQKFPKGKATNGESRAGTSADHTHVDGETRTSQSAAEVQSSVTENRSNNTNRKTTKGGTQTKVQTAETQTTQSGPCSIL